MNKSEVLSNIRKAQAACDRCDYLQDDISEIGAALKAAEAAMHEQESLSTPETEVDIIKMLARALQPFARIMTPDHYEDHDPVTVEIRVPKVFAEKYAKMHDDDMNSSGEASFPRPNLETGANWPTQILNVDGVNIGDIRFARQAIETITAPDENTLN